MKNGSIGIITLPTISKTMFWNSSNNFSVSSDFVHAVARPISIEKNNALITDITGGISNLNIISGSFFNPSVLFTILSFGTIAYPAKVDINAAPIDERYAIINA